MSNKKTSYCTSISKIGEKNYRVNYSYISPETHKKKEHLQAWICEVAGCKKLDKR